MPWRALILFVSLLAASGPAMAGEIAHTVKAGENPAALAKRYHVTVPAILARNQGLDPRRIKIGDVLVIPDAAAGPAPSVVVPAAGPTVGPAAGPTVAPAAGPTAAPDVASDVAPNAASDVGPDAGQGASAAPAPKAAAPGSADTPQDAAPAPKAAAPGAAPKPQPVAPPPPRAQPGASAKAAPSSSAVLPDEEAPGRRYVVVPGDCPADIAERFGIPLDVLWRANPGLDPKRLPVGCVLTVPEGAAGAPPAVAVTRPGDPGSGAPLIMDFQ